MVDRHLRDELREYPAERCQQPLIAGEGGRRRGEQGSGGFERAERADDIPGPLLKPDDRGDRQPQRPVTGAFPAPGRSVDQRCAGRLEPDEGAVVVEQFGCGHVPAPQPGMRAFPGPRLPEEEHALPAVADRCGVQRHDPVSEARRVTEQPQPEAQLRRLPVRVTVGAGFTASVRQPEADGIPLRAVQLQMNPSAPADEAAFGRRIDARETVQTASHRHVGDLPGGVQQQRRSPAFGLGKGREGRVKGAGKALPGDADAEVGNTVVHRVVGLHRRPARYCDPPDTSRPYLRRGSGPPAGLPER